MKTPEADITHMMMTTHRITTLIKAVIFRRFPGLRIRGMPSLLKIFHRCGVEASSSTVMGVEGPSLTESSSPETAVSRVMLLFGFSLSLSPAFMKTGSHLNLLGCSRFGGGFKVATFTDCGPSSEMPAPIYLAFAFCLFQTFEPEPKDISSVHGETLVLSKCFPW